MSFFDPTPTERLALEILRQNRGPMYGLDIIKKSKGKFGMGSLYVQLGRLEDRGFITSQLEIPRPGFMARRAYSITPDGRAKLMELEAAKAPATPQGATA